MLEKSNSVVLEETPLKNYIFFAMPRISASLVLGIVDFVILFLYVEFYGLSSILVGVALMMGKFAIAGSQFSMGYLSDTTKTKRLGKRKPFMIIGAPILAISFVLVLLPTVFLSGSQTQNSLFMWILIWDILFQFFYGVTTTPYQSWVAEQFQVNERPKASAFMNIFNYIGTGVSMLFVLLVLPRYLTIFEKTGVIESFMIIILIIFAALTVLFVYLSVIMLPIENAPPIQLNIVEDLKDLFKDRNYIHVCMLIGISSLTWSMITGLMLGYVYLVLGLTSTTDQLIAAMCLALGIMSSLFIWKKVIEKFGKKKALSFIFFWAIIFLPFAAIIPMMPFENFLLPAIILVLIIASALGGWFLFPYILYADLAEDYEKSNEEGELKAGLYNGFPSILLNIFQAFGLLITGLLLALPNAPGRNYSFGYLIWAPLGSVILIVAFFYLKKFITLDFDWEIDAER